MRKSRFVNKPVFFIIATVMLFIGLLFIGELLCRIKVSLVRKDSHYLFSLFEKSKIDTVEYKLDIKHFNPDIENSYYYKMEPGTYPPPNPYNYSYFTINSLGFRGKEVSPVDKNGKIRIFCIGESSTFGVESPDNQTWPVRLEYYLNQNKRNNFEVINAGFVGAASSTYKNLIRLELINYQPDIFIIYGGTNEMILDRNIKKKKVSKFTEYVHAKLYYKWSMLYTLLIEKISFLMHESPAPMNIYASDPKAVFAENIEWIIRFCKENNIKLIFVRQMFYSNIELFLRDEVSLEEIKSSLKKVKEGGWVTSQKIYCFNEMMKSLAGLTKKYEIPMMDFRKEFYSALEKNEQLYYDYIHLTPKGNDLLARLIFENRSWKDDKK